MDTLNTIDIARMQFGLNIAFHILFPSISIALGWILVWFRVQYARTGAPAWLSSYKLWTKVFALSFAVGVVSGIVMSFQFGTNWPGYMNTVGNVAGPLLAYEVLTAFFLEATFLGVMLFGMNRVPGWVHLLATVLVAVGTTISAFWILALNSWMHTPAGHTVLDGVIIAQNWWDVIFNPSFPYRFTHMLLASGLTAAFLVAGLSAWRLLKAPGDTAAANTLRTGVLIAATLAPLQILAGDMHGLNTLKNQPAKIAAMEALWETQKGAPLVLFGIPNERKRINEFVIEIPRAASIILRHESDGELKGLNEFYPDIPPVPVVFTAFRVMVGMGFSMLLISWAGAWRLRRRDNPRPRWLLWTFAGFTFAGWIATLAGWIVTETGRQPWLVTGILRTADAAGKVSEAQIGASFTGYIITYCIMLLAYIVVLTHLAAEGTDPKEPVAASGDAP